MTELDWWWSPHPSWEAGEDWDENVPVVRIESDDEVVLIDPFLPPDDSFDPHGKPVRVLLTQGAHYRGTSDFVERYAASVWAPPKAWWPPKRPDPATTRALPNGIEALELDGEPQQVVFWIPEHATLVTGDVISGTGERAHVFVDEADLYDSSRRSSGSPSCRSSGSSSRTVPCSSPTAQRTCAPQSPKRAAARMGAARRGVRAV